ncbi:hypothetical protein LTR86_005228 [Recurvomyces mirabilis]|nr:hypothetical protein LTR86_005228 [Recurvomyces mirabilis]
MPVKHDDKQGATAKDEEPPRGLLDLLPEIWSRISHYAAAQRPPYKIDDMRVCTKARQPAITMVCRALRAGALPHFYAVNEWCHRNHGYSTSGRRLHSWLDNMDAPYKHTALRRLTIHSRYIDAVEHYSIEFGIKLRGAPDTCNKHKDCILYCIDESPLLPKSK